MLTTRDIDIKIVNNPYNFQLNDLLEIGERLNNPKRNFLLISKVLGKHLCTKPNIVKSIGYLLGDAIYPNNILNTKKIINYIKNPIDEQFIQKELYKYINPLKDVFIVGFAETATALGMSVASCIKNSYYVTTTREKLPLKSLFDFEETHSHAVNHRCYLIKEDKFIKSKTVILVDDEITTGNTMMNLIKKMNVICPNKKYIVASIIDSRTKKYREKCKSFAKEYKINLSFKSLISTEIKIKNNNIYFDDIEDKIIEKTTNIQKIDGFNKLSYNNKKYTSISGRFGVSFQDILNIEEISNNIANKIKPQISENSKILVLGHGEDIYIPSRIASYLSSNNVNVMFKSTTRSPIYIDKSKNYPIKQRSSFKIEDVTYYLYNKDLIEKEFDKIFIISEFPINYKLSNKIQNINI